jgi:inner membrane protein
LLVFGHPGITLGVTLAISSPPSRIGAFLKRLDLRFLLVGSLLPDIIDKPVGDFFFHETISNGRIFSHTLLFLLIISIAGYLLWRRGHLWLAALAIGSFWHLVLDEIWLSPRTLFWPLFGFHFEKLGIDNPIGYWLHSLFSNPAVYIPEIIGALVLMWFVVRLIRRRALVSFLKSGKTGQAA